MTQPTPKFWNAFRAMMTPTTKPNFDSLYAARGETLAGTVMLGGARRDTDTILIESKSPLTKRAKRRLRGKAREARRLARAREMCHV